MLTNNQILTPVRTFSTGASGGDTSTPRSSPIPTELIHRSGLINLILPLPLNNEKCTFPLYPQKTVKDLILDIREEDRLTSKILLTDKEGNRISHETTLVKLLNTPWVLQIDEEKYTVEPLQVALSTENVLSNDDLGHILNHAYYERIRKKVLEEAGKRETLTYREFEDWCTSYGLSRDQITILSKALHKLGIIFHFHQSDHLKDYIFLRPEKVTESLTKLFNLKYQTQDAPKLLAELHTLLPRYIPLNDVKNQLDLKSVKSAKLWMRGAFGYLTLQFAVLARMVWIDFNWDIMEPITYFVGVFTLMGSYLFFVLYNEDYTYKALENRQRMLALKKLYLSHEFNWEKWHKLHLQVENLRKLLNIDINEEAKALKLKD